MTGNRISVSTCHAMKLIVTLILAMEIFDFPPSYYATAETSAIIVAEPSNFINLENTTAYNVLCTITEAPPDVNSSVLNFYDIYENIIKSEVLNETTILTRVNVQPNAACETKRYDCMMSKSEELTGLAAEEISLGRPPAVISQDDLTCILEHLNYMHCQLPVPIQCDDSDADLKLSTVLRDEFLECNWRQQEDFIHWDSRNNACDFSMTDPSTHFELGIRNKVGAQIMMFNVTHGDIVRPDKPSHLTAVRVNPTTANVTWNMQKLNLLRQFKYEFRLISGNGSGDFIRFVTESKMISSYLVEDLIPHTNYTFKVRVQIVPEITRPSDDLYWSESGSVTFKTVAHRPMTAPTVAPGTYSIKKRTNGQLNVSIFWEAIPNHLHNGTGFGYRVTAVSNTGYNFTDEVNVSTYTFTYLPIGHYRIQVSSFNDEGASDHFNEMQIFSRLDDDRRPQIRAVFKADGYNVSWIAPKKSNPSNYTLMYCHFTSQGTCHDAIQFVTIPAGRTFFVTPQDSMLNFAVSANYADNYSSELSWQHCVVAPRTSRLGAPKYLIESVTVDSMTVRMVERCEEHSFYERMEIHVRNLKGKVVWNTGKDHYVEVIHVEGLESSTEYEVVVTVFDGFGKSSEKVTRSRTESKGIWLHLSVIIIFAAAAIVFIVIVAIQKLRFVLDIKVDIPIGLLEDQKDSVEVSEPDDHEEFYNLTCPTIPEESELVAADSCHPDPVSTPEEPIPVESGVAASAEIPITREGPYIEMLSWKRPPETDQPPIIDANGNYEQMHAPSKQSMIVRSTGYVKMNLFINRARTGNYTQTMV